MILLQCKEVGFLVPKETIGANWQNMHALVTDIVTDGQHTENKPKIVFLNHR